MKSLDQRLANAREAYRSVRYRGPALNPERVKRRAHRPLGWGWRPALAASAALVALVAVLVGTRAPEPPPARSAASQTPMLTSPMGTLSAARRIVAATPVAPARPSDSRFRLPSAPTRPSRFADDDVSPLMQRSG